MMRPIVNINGTSAKELIEVRKEAIGALNILMKMLLQITPNGRDYPDEQERCHEDRQAHFDRIAQLSTLRNDLMQEAYAIMEQRANRSN